MSAIHYHYDNPWLISERGFDAKNLAKTESIFCQGNGYIGLRASSEEKYPLRKCGLFVAGTFARFSAKESPELPNCPDMTGIDIYLNDNPLNLHKGHVSGYEKKLHLKDGELTRSFIWQTENFKVFFRFRRFVSMASKHIFVQQVEITNLGHDFQLAVSSGIDGQVTNSGSQLFEEGEKVFVDRKYLQMATSTIKPRIPFVLTCMHRFYRENIPHEANSRITMKRRMAENQFHLELASGQTILIEKLCSIYTGRDENSKGRDLVSYLKSQGIEELINASNKSYDQLLHESAVAWNEIWKASAVEIESDDMTDQLAINFARYHLHIMAPYDERMNIGAKGLSGEGYKGHTFWDTEIMMLPYFTLCYPDIAQKLLKYRYHGLSGARKKARSNGYRGAQYPWEAARPSAGEVTPLLGPIDIVTGKQTMIWSGLLEQHITSDIVYGLYQYINATDDQHFMQQYGSEIILETALFWESRLEWNERLSRYELKNIIGPDEYREHINNNAYTNYMVYWNMDLAISVYEKLSTQNPLRFTRLKKKLNLPDDTVKWRRIADLIYLPKPDINGIIPQDDEYLNGESINLDEYKNASQVAAIFQHYNHEQIREKQISKQADVLLMLLLHEQYFPKNLLKPNWDFYEPRTLHDSSLSFSTHAILAASIDEKEKAYLFFQKAKNIDIGHNMQSSDEGIHAAAMGGIWQTVVFGFGGLRIVDGELRIEPRLPEKWQKLSYSFYWHGELIAIDIKKDFFLAKKNRSNKAISFIAFGTVYSLIDILTVKLGELT